jgi:hypothetical protein
MPRERITVVVHADPPLTPSPEAAAAGVRAVSAALDGLGRDARLFVIGDWAAKLPDVTGLPEGHTAEPLRSDDPSDGYGPRLRRALRKADTDLILRVPAAGLDFASLKNLLARATSGPVKPDLVFGVRPTAPAGLGERLGRWLSEKVWVTVFGLPVRDPSCPVQLLRRKVLDDSLPRCAGPFADYELVARANFVGHLLDEVPLGKAWTGGPKPPMPWSGMWREAWHLLNHPDFERRLPQPTQPASPSGGGRRG